MGYNIAIKYKKLDGEGVPTGDEVEKQKRLGKADSSNCDDSVLAAEILYWYFRRDIRVTNIEVEEFVKRKVNISEKPDGVIIRGKKYTLRNAITEQDAAAVNTADVPSSNQFSNQSVMLEATAKHKVLREEVCNPSEALRLRDPDIVQKLQAKGIVIGKAYKIVKEDSAGAFTMYTIVNNSGELQKVNSELFDTVSVPRLAIGGQPAESNGGDNSPKLSFIGNAGSALEMPDIRQGK